MNKKPTFDLKERINSALSLSAPIAKMQQGGKPKKPAKRVFFAIAPEEKEVELQLQDESGKILSTFNEDLISQNHDALLDSVTNLISKDPSSFVNKDKYDSLVKRVYEQLLSPFSRKKPPTQEQINNFKKLAEDNVRRGIVVDIIDNAYIQDNYIIPLEETLSEVQKNYGVDLSKIPNINKLYGGLSGYDYLVDNQFSDNLKEKENVLSTSVDKTFIDEAKQASKLSLATDGVPSEIIQLTSEDDVRKKLPEILKTNKGKNLEYGIFTHAGKYIVKPEEINNIFEKNMDPGCTLGLYSCFGLEQSQSLFPGVQKIVHNAGKPWEGVPRYRSKEDYDKLKGRSFYEQMFSTQLGKTTSPKLNVDYIDTSSLTPDQKKQLYKSLENTRAEERALRYLRAQARSAGEIPPNTLPEGFDLTDFMPGSPFSSNIQSQMIPAEEDQEYLETQPLQPIRSIPLPSQLTQSTQTNNSIPNRKQGGMIPKAQNSLWTTASLPSTGVASGSTVVSNEEIDRIAQINRLARQIIKKNPKDFTKEEAAILEQATIKDVKKPLGDYRIAVANAARKAGWFASPEKFAESTSAIGPKASLQRLPIVGDYIPDELDVTRALGEMASGLGRIPQNVKEGKYGAAALDIAIPLATGALGGLGAKTTGQFVNQMVNPLAGTKDLILKNRGKYLMRNYNAVDYRKNPLSEKELEMFKWFDEEMRFNKLPQTTNKQSLEVLENFKQRIKTPEGQRRMEELGITENQMLHKLKIIEDNTSYGYFRPSKNTIAIHPDHPMAGKVARHEIEHGVQNALRQSKINKVIDGTTEERLKALNSKTTEIDDILSNLSLRKEGTPNKVWKQREDFKNPVNINEYSSLISNKQNATDYFLTGSEGAEKSAFLGEVQEYMMKKGVIPTTNYVNVTPEMVKNTFVDAMFDEEGGGKYLRLFNIMKADRKNYELISKALNKMLTVTPIIGTGAYLQNKENNPNDLILNRKQGGMTTYNLKERINKIIQQGGNVSTAQQALGYKDNSPFKNMPFQDIYSDRITMEGVSQPIVAQTDNGISTVMQPGGEYSFPGASVVREIPLMRRGGLTKALGFMPNKFQDSGATNQEGFIDLDYGRNIFTSAPVKMGKNEYYQREGFENEGYWRKTNEGYEYIGKKIPEAKGEEPYRATQLNLPIRRYYTLQQRGMLGYKPKDSALSTPIPADRRGTATGNKTNWTQEEIDAYDKEMQRVQAGESAQSVQGVQGAQGTQSAQPIQGVQGAQSSAAATTQDPYIYIKAKYPTDRYEYRYNKSTGMWETKQKTKQTWIILDDSTERYRRAKAAIIEEFGDQIPQKNVFDVIKSKNTSTQGVQNVQPTQGIQSVQSTTNTVAPIQGVQGAQAIQSTTTTYWVNGGQVGQYADGGDSGNAFLSGAATGAKLGTMLLPGIGTGIGAAAGALFGSLMSNNKSRSAEAARVAAESSANKRGDSTLSNIMQLLSSNNGFTSLLRGPDVNQNTQPQAPSQWYGYSSTGGLMTPGMAQLLPPPFQSGGSIESPVYTNQEQPQTYSINQITNPSSSSEFTPPEIKMDKITRPSDNLKDLKIVTFLDHKTNKTRRAYIDKAGNIIGYVPEEGEDNKAAYDKSIEETKQYADQQVAAINNNPVVPNKQQGGPIITGLLMRNMSRNNEIKSNISANKNKLQNVINLSRGQNPFRMMPQGVYKTGGLITEGGTSKEQAGFSSQPISGASSTGPLGPKRTETPDYTNSGVRSIMDLPTNEYVSIQNMVPIQAEVGEMIVLPTGDLMPVMARKRHHQMKDDEVTDITPENSYILSAHGEVRINKDEADLLITETGVKPYRIGTKQNPPTEKTLASIMTKKVMKPAEVAKKINSLFPVVSTENPFEIAANIENKINRKPYLEGLIQLSELDKYRKGLSEPAMSDMQQASIESGSPMMQARQGGKMFRRSGVVKAQNGIPNGLPGDYTIDQYNVMAAWNPYYFGNIPASGAGTATGDLTDTRTNPDQTSVASQAVSGIAPFLNLGARWWGADSQYNAQMENIARQRGIYDQGFGEMSGLMNVGTGLEAAMLGAQNPFVKWQDTPSTYIDTLRTQTPQSQIEAAYNRGFANLPDYSSLGRMGLGAESAARAQALQAGSDFLTKAQEADREAFNKQQLLRQDLLAQNTAGRLQAQRATDAAINKMLSGYGNLANRFTQGRLGLTSQRMGADLALANAQLAARANRAANRVNAFTTFTSDLTSGVDDLMKILKLIV